MAKDDQYQQEGEELHSLNRSRSASADSDIVVHPAPNHRPQLAIPQRQSSFAQPRTHGNPRTNNRVRFDVEDSLHSASIHDDDEEEDDRDSWLDDEDYMSSHGQGRQRSHTGQRAPLLTDIEAPSVTVAESDFNPEDLLESARPKSGMRSAFMNMANSIMYVDHCVFLFVSIKTDVDICSGAGIIGQPYALKQAGLLTGVVLLLVLTVTVDWTIRLIVINSKLSGANSFQATMEHCFGRSGLVAISIAQWAFAFGGMVAFCIIVGDTIPHVMSALFPSLADAHFLWLLTDRRAIIVLFILGISYPLSLYRDIAKVCPLDPVLLMQKLTGNSSQKQAQWHCSVCS
jgi:sodium-coupled neutral amino acid transporter 11